MQARIVDEAPMRMPVVRELDGIRAIAVLIVFASHVGWGRYVPGGLGVTIFFFLSGYLITSLLYAEMATTGRISLGGFYLRRTLRIFPPLYITLGLSALLVATGVLHRTLSPRTVLSQLFFLSNYERLLGPPHGLPGPPLWSLAVEEHFYLVFPLVFATMLATLPARRAGALCLGACLAPLVFRLLSVPMGWPLTLNYYLTHTRVDSILFGCALALGNNVVLQPQRSWRPGSAWFAAAMAVLLAAAFINQTIFAEIFRYSIQGLALLVIFAFVLRPNRLTSPVLTSQPLQLIGRYSYSLYLIHVLVIQVLRTNLPVRGSLVLAPLAAVASMIYAWAMFTWVERPLADVRRRLHREPAPEPAATARDQLPLPMASASIRG